MVFPSRRFVTVCQKMSPLVYNDSRRVRENRGHWSSHSAYVPVTVLYQVMLNRGTMLGFKFVSGRLRKPPKKLMIPFRIIIACPYRLIGGARMFVNTVHLPGYHKSQFSEFRIQKLEIRSYLMFFKPRVIPWLHALLTETVRSSFKRLLGV